MDKLRINLMLTREGREMLEDLALLYPGGNGQKSNMSAAAEDAINTLWNYRREDIAKALNERKKRFKRRG